MKYNYWFCLIVPIELFPYGLNATRLARIALQASPAKYSSSLPFRLNVDKIFLAPAPAGPGGCVRGLSTQEKQEAAATTPAQTMQTATKPLYLLAPYTTESATRRGHVTGWPAGKTPTAPAGFAVAEYPDRFDSPR